MNRSIVSLAFFMSAAVSWAGLEISIIDGTSLSLTARGGDYVGLAEFPFYLPSEDITIVYGGLTFAEPFSDRESSFRVENGNQGIDLTWLYFDFSETDELIELFFDLSFYASGNVASPQFDFTLSEDESVIYTIPDTAPFRNYDYSRLILVEGAFTGADGTDHEVSFKEAELSVDLSKVGGDTVLSWQSGVLQSTSTLGGWIDVVGATSPYIVDSSASSQFFRVRAAD